MVNVHSVQVVVAVVCNDDLVCMVCKCTAVCHVLLGVTVKPGLWTGLDWISGVLKSSDSGTNFLVPKVNLAPQDWFLEIYC